MQDRDRLPDLSPARHVSVQNASVKPRSNAWNAGRNTASPAISRVAAVEREHLLRHLAAAHMEVI